MHFFLGALRVKKLKTSLHRLDTSYNQLHEAKEQAGELVRYLMQSQFESMSILKNELETEKKTVHKFVAQNVERQHEIVRLKTELAELTRGKHEKGVRGQG